MGLDLGAVELVQMAQLFFDVPVPGPDLGCCAARVSSAKDLSVLIRRALASSASCSLDQVACFAPEREPHVCVGIASCPHRGGSIEIQVTGTGPRMTIAGS